MAQDPAFDKVYALIRMTADAISMGEQLMANQADLAAKLAELQSGQTELLKDVRRLITEGDTSGAITVLDDVIAKNATADAEVEAASPEPAPPVDGGADGDPNTPE
jgi:cell division protein YceG involved in septum cleavage